MSGKHPQKNIEYLFGLHSSLSVLQKNPLRILEVYLQQGRSDPKLDKILAEIQHNGLPTQWVARKTLDKLAEQGNHQGIVLRCKAEAEKDEFWLLEQLEQQEQVPLLLVLDGVQDPHNLGACLRSADAAGVNAVIIPKDRAVGMNATVRKVASGGAENVPLITVTNLARTLRNLQEQGIWLVGLAGEAQATLYATDLTGPMALVMGAEEKGLRRLTRDTCDQLVKIPMLGQVESLNVSAASSVCLFEVLRQRQFSK